ncbi:MAG: hypothetical protein V2I33_11255, partial [Kangiellaceae bacterium]|nr:hypothetical protein [Kangiellaceae bacterium]
KNEISRAKNDSGFIDAIGFFALGRLQSKIMVMEIPLIIEVAIVLVVSSVIFICLSQNIDINLALILCLTTPILIGVMLQKIGVISLYKRVD